MDRSYEECTSFPDWTSRLNYLSLRDETYNSPRDISHPFYTSQVWRKFKKDMHTRDLGCDLALLGVYFEGRMYLHHINPVTERDLLTNNLNVLINPSNVITASGETHNLIHYKKEIIQPHVERRPGDTILW